MLPESITLRTLESARERLALPLTYIKLIYPLKLMNRAYGTDKIISRKGGKAPLGVQLGRTRLLVSGNEPFAPTKLHYGLIMYF